MSSEPLHEAYRLIREGSKDEARRLLVPFVRTDPLNADAWWLLANALEEPGKQRRALEKVLELRPDDERAQRMYDRILLDAEPARAAAPPPAAPAIEFDPTAVFEEEEGFESYPDEELPPFEEVRVHKSGGSSIGTIILAIIGLVTILGCALCVLTLTVAAPVITRVANEVMLTVTVMPEFQSLARLASTPTAPTSFTIPDDLKMQGVIELGQTVQGALDGITDDGWAFVLNDTQPIIIELSATDSQLDPHLYVYAPDGNLLAENDDIDGANNRNARIEANPVQKGTYTIRVSAFSDGGDYDLTLRRE
ncbi:MAG: PPC domain-containing protein [Anaerolineae bacterium]|nr:PPC domain-containing protein [Anaerolineae bacterium]